jgi:hypothetical protein
MMPFTGKITEIFFDFDEYLKGKFSDAGKVFSLTNQSSLSLYSNAKGLRN